MNSDDLIRVVSKIRNNRLQSFREDIGLGAREFAGRIGLSYNLYLRIEGLKHYPSIKVANKIAETLGESVEFLFPGILRKVAKTTSVHTIPEARFVSLSEIPKIKLIAPSYEESADAEELRGVISEALYTLTPREELVLKLKFGLEDEIPRTGREIANLLSVCPERVSQIERKALRKLRQPLRSEKLKDFVTG